MTQIRNRPASAIALLASIVWIGVCLWEQYIANHNGNFNVLPGHFYGLLDVVQWSALGVISFTALAYLVERIWVPAPQVASRGGLAAPPEIAPPNSES